MSVPDSVHPRPYLLANRLQHYDWGSSGREAFIPQLLGTPAKAGLPYAELWMGAHPKAPSEIALDGLSLPLSEVIFRHPLQILGDRVSQRFNGTLPFLLKILSVAQPLSIQAHPGKEQARALHARDPDGYPDENHKPELAIALGSFRALVGFRSTHEVLEILQRYPEIAQFIGPDAAYELRRVLRSPRVLAPQDGRRFLRSALGSLLRTMSAEYGRLRECVGQLGTRLRRSAESLTEAEQLFLALLDRYGPADPGLLLLFLLRPIHLSEGQGIFIEPGTPHVYLSGNIVECMANSDNVVRAGLTRKHTDLSALVDILSWKTDLPPILSGNPGHDYIDYPTPAVEFRVSRWRLNKGKVADEPTAIGPRIVLVTKGQLRICWRAGGQSSAMDLMPGDSVLLPAILAELVMTPRGSAEVFRVEVP